ncbi:MAG: phage tail tube protein [Actinomycetota bacterium]|nr:phage tail tube protein [Actinomycetota bacterium]
MAPTNKFLIGIALQSAKGAPAAAPQYRIKCTGSPSLSPNIERSKLEETSGNRDGGERETNRISVGGDFACYLRSTTAPLLFYGALGAKSATAGALAGDDTTHLVTAADDQPYFTIWRFWGGVLAERFEDCKFTLQFSGSAGQSAQVTASVMGLNFSDVTDSITFDPYTTAGGTGAGVLDTSPTIRIPGVVYNVNAAANADISEFSMNINAAQNTQQTTKITDSIMEPGLREIEVNFTETAKLGTHRKLVYGGTAGRTPTQTITRESFDATFLDAANVQRLKLTVPSFAYLTGELPVNANGEIGNMQVTGAADPPASGSIVSAEIKNAVAGYAAA